MRIISAHASKSGVQLRIVDEKLSKKKTGELFLLPAGTVGKHPENWRVVEASENEILVEGGAIYA